MWIYHCPQRLVLSAIVAASQSQNDLITVQVLARETGLDYWTVQAALWELIEHNGQLFRSVHDRNTKDILCVTHAGEAARRALLQKLPGQRSGGTSHWKARQRGVVGRLVRSVGGAVITRFIADWALDTYHR